MQEPLVDGQRVVEYLDRNGVDLGFVMASPLKEGKGPKSENMPDIQKWYLKGLNNSVLGHTISRIIFPKLSSGMFTQELDNPRVISAVRDNPDRLFAWLFAKPERGLQETQAEIDKLKADIETGDFNLAGIKMHFWIYPADIRDDRIVQIADLAKGTKNPILMDAGVDRSRMRRFGELAEMYPEVPIIVAHLGTPEIIEAAKRYTNVFLDMSGYTITGKRLSDVVKQLAPDKVVQIGSDQVKMPDSSQRIIFGSDSPGGLGGSIQDSLQVLADANLSERDEELILADNIVSLVPKAGQLLKKRQTQ